MRGQSLAATALAALLAMGGGACRRGGAPPSVGAVQIIQGRAAEAVAEAGVAPAEIEGLTRTALSDAGFRLAPGPRAYRARLEVLSLRVSSDAKGNAWSEAVVALELRPGDGEEPRPRPSLGETGRGLVPVGTAPSAAWRAAIEEASREAASRLAIAVAAEEKTTAALLEDLEAADPRVRERAIVVLGERRSAEAVPALLARLQDPEPRLVDLAVGALAQTRDTRAVGPLIDLSRRRPPREQARFARLLGDIGGGEARGYLETLAAGASEPGLRHAAAEALADLSAGEQASPRAVER